MALFLVVHRDQAFFGWYGYRLDWMPEGVVPSRSFHKQMNPSGQVGVGNEVDDLEAGVRPDGKDRLPRIHFLLKEDRTAAVRESVLLSRA
jgi:hypothetical protein